MNSADQARVKRAQKRIAQGVQTIRDASAEIAEIIAGAAAPPRAIPLTTGIDQPTKKTA